MDEKRFYWIKLKTNFFNSDAIDFLMSQKKGCDYIVLYQMLCLMTANNNGFLSSKIGEMIIPYDIDKIVRDTKYFDRDTVLVALELFKRLGLVYEENDNILRISGTDQLVGSEAGNSNALRQRRYRERQRQLKLENVTNNNACNVIADNEEYRDKSIEYRDKILEEEKEDKKEKRNSRFLPPSIEEIKAYCIERKNCIDPEQFYDFYTSKGWKVGSSQMKDWKACIRTWEKRDGKTGPCGVMLATERDNSLDDIF